ncbi:MAG: GNAT family N-acetyltransferase, partial [Mesorhizobium sp.]
FRNRLRLLVPFSVERPAIPLGVPVMRTWSSPFGPLGTPLVDRDDPVGVIEDFFSMLSRPHLKLPKVFVLPDIKLDGPVASLLTSFADSRGLTLVVTGKAERPVLESDADGDDYLKASLRAHHYREFRRLKRRLAGLGKLDHVVARGPDEIRHAIHTLTLDGRTIASLVVFVEAGVAYTWKTAYDETLSAYSPGTLLMIEVTKQHLDDPNVAMTDSCAVPDHPVMSRLWT